MSAFEKKKHKILVVSDRPWAIDLTRVASEDYIFARCGLDEVSNIFRSSLYQLGAVICDEFLVEQIAGTGTFPEFEDELADLPLVIVGDDGLEVNLVSHHVKYFSEVQELPKLFSLLDEYLRSRRDLLEERAFVGKIFLEEAEELLEELYENVKYLKSKGGSPEVSTAIRRIAHTLKVSGAISNELMISEYAKCFESMMTDLIENRRDVGPSLVERICKVSDRLTEMVTLRKAGEGFNEPLESLVKDFQ